MSRVCALLWEFTAFKKPRCDSSRERIDWSTSLGYCGFANGPSGEMSLDRLPTAVETTAYATIAEAIEDASLRGATFVSVGASHEDGLLVVDVEDDGRERASPLTVVDDRVGAIGGSAATGPKSLRAVLPCA